MCYRSFQSIKTVSSLAPRQLFVPCGECPSCRAIKKASWAFRLRVEAETLVKQGWSVGFMTLTYNDKSVPRLPYECLTHYAQSKYSRFVMPMCFNRNDVNKLIKDVRNWLYRTKKIAHEFKLRFLVASEYGETTKRPHYHALFIIPPQIDPRDFYQQVKQSWMDKGFIIPAEFEGGYDSKHVYHNPFLVDCVSKACVYTAKYVCKDLAFYEKKDRKDFKKYFVRNGIEDKLTNYFPFHSQSKSLGIAFLDGLSEQQKIDYYLHGASFVGDDRLRQLPVYLKNKLVFANYYVTDNQGNRLCRRIATKFFEDNYRQIFAEKVRMTAERVKKWLKDSPMVELDNRKISLSQMYAQLQTTPEAISAEYHAYYGVQPQYCYVYPMDKFWFERYRYVTDGVEICDNLINEANSEPWRYLTIDSFHKRKMETFFTIGQICDIEHLKSLDIYKLDDERLVNGIRDFYYS